MKSRLPLLLAAIGIILRIVPAWAMPLWYDENFTVLVARLPLPQLIQATAGDVHPPLWYLLIWPLAHIPSLAPWIVVRLPAVIFGIACLWVWWKILGIMARVSQWNWAQLPNSQLVAFGLFCLLPQQIYYSQEGRMYSLLTLLVLLAWYFILTRRWVWLAAVASAMLWLQNYGLIYAAALWLAALIYDRRTWKQVTLALTAAGVSFIPWVIVLLRQMGDISGNYWMIRFSLGSVLGELLHIYFGTMTLAPDIVNIGVFFGVVTWVLIWSLRRRSLNLPAVILAFLPWLLAIGISAAWQPIILYRALIPSGAFLCLILAEPMEYLGRRAQLLLAVFFVPALLVNLASVSMRVVWASNWVELDGSSSEIVDANWQPGDLLYYVDDGVFVSGAVHWKNIDNALQEPQCGTVLGGLTDQTQNALGMRSGPLPANYPSRIWVISGMTPLMSKCFDDYLRDNGLMDSHYLYCSQDNALVRSCLYLVEGK